MPKRETPQGPHRPTEYEKRADAERDGIAGSHEEVMPMTMISVCLRMCVCVCERERERVSELMMWA